MSGSSKTLRTFLLIYGLSLLANLGAIHVLHVPNTPLKLEKDALEYYDLSRHLGQSGYDLDSRRGPGHIFILAALETVARDNLVLLQQLVSIFFSLTAPLVYLLGLRIGFRRSIAAASGCLTAVWPLFISCGITLYSETTALPIFLAFLVSLPRGEMMAAFQLKSVWRWIGSGLLLGACILTRPMYMIFILFLVPIAWSESGSFVKALYRCLLILSGTLLAISPWSLWISHHEKHFVLVSTNGGETIAGGLNANILTVAKHYITADGRQSWVGPGKWISGYYTSYLSEQELQLPRHLRNQILMQRTIAWMAAHPTQAFSLECHKLAYMWAIYPFWNGTRQTLLGNIPTLLLLIFASLGLFYGRQSIRHLAIPCCLPLFVSAVALISWGSWRFREPGDVGLLLLATLGATALIDNLFSQKREPGNGSLSQGFSEQQR